jgi:hypothetical protein
MRGPLFIWYGVSYLKALALPIVHPRSWEYGLKSEGYSSGLMGSPLAIPKGDRRRVGGLSALGQGAKGEDFGLYSWYRRSGNFR